MNNKNENPQAIQRFNLMQPWNLQLASIVLSMGYSSSCSIIFFSVQEWEESFIKRRIFTTLKKDVAFRQQVFYSPLFLRWPRQTDRCHTTVINVVEKTLEWKNWMPIRKKHTHTSFEIRRRNKGISWRGEKVVEFLKEHNQRPKLHVSGLLTGRGGLLTTVTFIIWLWLSWK